MHGVVFLRIFSSADKSNLLGMRLLFDACKLLTQIMVSEGGWWVRVVGCGGQVGQWGGG